MKQFDVVIIGSGFGGSVSALRLAEKGYRVAVLEAGARFADADFAKNSWQLHKFIFMPGLGMKGIQRIHVLPDVLVLAGAGVGGGSLNYANTLYEPPASYFEDSQWRHITDWRAELAPWYDQAKRMLGVVPNEFVSPADELLRDVARGLGVEHTFRLTPVGVHFGSGPGAADADPFFGGAGPERNGCTNCGECMTGCRFNAKNTLVKNYLALAERLGVEVFPLTTVTDFKQSSTGWEISTRRTGSLLPGPKFGADQLIVAAGTYNTQKLLHRMRSKRRLPNLSHRLGELTRTNSESLVGAVAPRGRGHDFTLGSAITSSIYVDEHTHVEPVRYGKGSNVMAFLSTLLTEGASPGARRRHWLRQAIRRPVLLFRLLVPNGWSERTVIALVMQNLHSALRLSARRTPFGIQLTSRPDPVAPAPKLIPQANEVARRMAEQVGGTPMGTLGDLFGAPFTAHFVGGAVVGDSAETGVIDPYHRVWNYPTLHVVDGAAVTANLGVNPSLTITAQAERALSFWPNRGDADPRPAQSAAYQRLAAVPPKSISVPLHAPARLWTATS